MDKNKKTILVSCHLSSHSRSIIVLLLAALALPSMSASARFTSHVRVATPAHTYEHGVGEALPASQLSQQPRVFARRPYKVDFHGHFDAASGLYSSISYGYPKVQPTIPFNQDEIVHRNAITSTPWRNSRISEHAVPLLPASPYRVASPNPESLWPEGLFVPPRLPLNMLGYGFEYHLADKVDTLPDISDLNVFDPYLLDEDDGDSNSVWPRGSLYHGAVPHTRLLLDDQRRRSHNGLPPLRLGSIRPDSPFYRL